MAEKNTPSAADFPGMKSFQVHQGDLPGDIDFGDIVAIDTETMGLNILRDRLCLAQLSDAEGNCHIVQFKDRNYNAPNLVALLENPDVTKLFHFGRFDIATLSYHLETICAPVYCTKIASKLARTFTDRHGYKNLCQELLGIDISKQQQQSDWGSPDLKKEQLIYAATDALHLHKIREILNAMLEREGRMELANACFEFLPARAELDLAGWPEIDIFSH